MSNCKHVKQNSTEKGSHLYLGVTNP